MDAKQLLEAAQILEAMNHSVKNEWLPVFAAIGGALVGGIATFVPSFLLERQRRKDERLTVTNALLAEVRSILSIVEQRQYLKNIREKEALLREKSPEETIKFSIRIAKHYSRVYQSHVDRLGTLDSAFATKIIQFHQLLDSVVQDVSPGGVIAEDEGNHQAFSQLVEITEKAINLGEELVRDSNPTAFVPKESH